MKLVSRHCQSWTNSLFPSNKAMNAKLASHSILSFKMRLFGDFQPLWSKNFVKIEFWSFWFFSQNNSSNWNAIITHCGWKVFKKSHFVNNIRVKNQIQRKMIYFESQNSNSTKIRKKGKLNTNIQSTFIFTIITLDAIVEKLEYEELMMLTWKNREMTRWKCISHNKLRSGSLMIYLTIFTIGIQIRIGFGKKLVNS